ncbi:MAG: hypothetical protein R3E42_13155 [Burkholderiaceae bacterium]
MNQLSRLDYQARLQQEQPPIFLPVGALEQHGPTRRWVPTACQRVSAGHPAG